MGWFTDSNGKRGATGSNRGKTAPKTWARPPISTDTTRRNAGSPLGKGAYGRNNRGTEGGSNRPGSWW
jgi:hypothetical protein